MNSPLIKDEKSTEISSLLVPMVDHQLLLPTVSVAEMIPYFQPNQEDHPIGAPNWFLGHLSWRGVQVPIISFEAINGHDIAPIQPSSQIAILNNTGQHNKLHFIAMPTQGIPHLCRVVASEISDNRHIPCQNYELRQVFVAGEQAAIPDIERLEQACIQILAL